VNTGTHFYTISEGEKNAIIQTLPNYHFEGPAYYAYTSG
jgi:lysyl endopeptidase